MTSSYYLAVDVGTSRTAAATARLGSDGSFVTAPFSLGRNTDSTPSAIFVSEGELLYGEAAERRGLTQPERLVREFKRRVGDDVPIVAGDKRFAPEDLYAGMVGWVVDAVTEREGRQPASIIVTVPVTWGDYRAELIDSALEREGWRDVQFISEPEAAARHYEATNPLEPGAGLGVYDLGGGTFDAVVLRKNSGGDVSIVGEPVGIADFGGANFDDAVLRHILTSAGLSAVSLAADATARVGLASLRRECVDAKESLSFDSETIVPVLLGGSSTTVRLTRSEFEGMIEAGIEKSIDVLSSALETWQVRAEHLDAILLTGGSSRIPRIAQLLSERFDRPIAIDADPKAIIALGALRILADRADAPSAEEVTTAAWAAEQSDAIEADAEETTGSSNHFRGKGRRWRLPTFAYLSAGSLVAALGLVLVSATALGNGGGTFDKASADGSFLESLYLNGPETGVPEAAGPMAPAAAPEAPAQDVSSGDSKKEASAKSPGRRVGPKAASMERATPPASKAWAESRPAAPPNQGTTPGGNSGGGGSQPSSGGTDPSPAADPQPATDPTSPPPTTDPTDPPPTTDPTDPPPTTDPTDPPPTTDPTDPPPTTDPTDPPPTTDPTDPPPTTDPTDPPAATDPPPASSEPTATP